MSWSWRTKPRSIIKTVEWFPDFAALEGQNWNLESGEVSRRNGKPIHPIRRSYIYAAHGEDDAWLDFPFRSICMGRWTGTRRRATAEMIRRPSSFMASGMWMKREESA